MQLELGKGVFFGCTRVSLLRLNGFELLTDCNPQTNGATKTLCLNQVSLM